MHNIVWLHQILTKIMRSNESAQQDNAGSIEKNASEVKVCLTKNN